ncbi:unnamed protein product, partial [Symbiodinium sp. CCMP2456]
MASLASLNTLTDGVAMVARSWTNMSDIPEAELDDQIKAATANLANLQKQLAVADPEPVPSPVPGAPATATSSGEHMPGNPVISLKNCAKSNTVEMLKGSSKLGEEAGQPSAPTEIKSTPRKPASSQALSIEIADTPEIPSRGKPSPSTQTQTSRPDVRRQLFGSAKRPTPKKKLNAPKPEGYWVRRHFMPNAKGEVRCTPHILDLGKTLEGREQLRKLLLDHGTFDKIEGVLEKWHIQKKKSAEMGGTVTKQWLIEVRTMADNAFDWARRNGRLYKSEIHGEEEADIPLEWTWQTSKESGQKTGFASAFSMDDPSGSILDGANEDLGKPTDGLQGQTANDSVTTAQAGASF